MADPTIQTFCCHSASNRSQDGDLLFEFNTPAYNIVCAVSSVIGVFGAIFQVINASYVCNIAINIKIYIYIISSSFCQERNCKPLRIDGCHFQLREVGKLLCGWRWRICWLPLEFLSDQCSGSATKH